LSMQEAALLVLQAAEAVSETHGHGIMLREMQPQHLFVTTRAGGSPLVKLIDFGTSKLMRDVAGPGGGEMTATTVVGLSAYASPEVLRKSKTIDVRADVWSLGALLYFVLTGRPPFDGDMATLLFNIAKETPVPVTQLRPDVPREVDQIISWSMAKEAEGRFANVHGFAHALRPFVTAEGQVLIDRIGAITHAAKQRKKTGSVPPPPLPTPAPPPRASAGSQPVIEEEESVTRMIPTSAAIGEMERTMFLAGDFVPQPPGPPRTRSRGRRGPCLSLVAAEVPSSGARRAGWAAPRRSGLRALPTRARARRSLRGRGGRILRRRRDR
jgi:serine/threonine protein kinase